MAYSDFFASEIQLGSTSFRIRRRTFEDARSTMPIRIRVGALAVELGGTAAVARLVHRDDEHARARGLLGAIDGRAIELAAELCELARVLGPLHALRPLGHEQR